MRRPFFINAKIQKLQAMINESHRLVFFGGAGVSTESGVPDFRSTDGLYHQAYDYPPEVIISHSFYLHHPEEFYRFYKNRMLYLDAKPNAAHRKLAELEKAGRLLAVVTQNIDGLHQLAGSQRVYELHGSVHRNSCQKCGQIFDAAFVKNSEGVPRCSACGGAVKPDVVLYEEALDAKTMAGAVRAIEAADMLIVGGTSLVVYPAAGMIRYFHGRHLVLINKSETQADNEAELLIREPIGEVLGQISCP